MRIILLIYIVPVIIITASLHAAAQGSLGDPIYTFDFGSGTNPGAPLGSNYTNMSYTNGCPVDGRYTIATNLNNGGSLDCYPSWQDLPTDHTGNPNGYMMIINASFTPSVFFTAPLPANVVLCQNTNYRFSSYICNLIRQSSSAGTIYPDITFTVTAPDGTLLASQNTGAINPTALGQSPWQQFGVNFNTKGYTTVVVTMTNNASGGDGNDLALDDISFTAYGPAVTTPAFAIGSGPASICQGQKETYSLSTFIQQGIYINPVVIWQENLNGAGWVTIPNEKSQTLNLNYTFNPANTPGIYQYRQGVAESANINSPDCRVYSDPTTITVNSLPIVTGVEPSESICTGSVLTLSASGGASYVWTGPNMEPTSTNPLIITDVTTANSGIYTVTAASESGCQAKIITTKVTVFPKAQIKVTAGTHVICEGEPTRLFASGGVSYRWSPGNSLSDSTVADPIAKPSDTTEYKVVITDVNGCIDTGQIIIYVNKKAVVNAGSTRYIFEGQEVKLDGTAKFATKVYWTPKADFSEPDILDPVINPKETLTYTLHGVSAGGCGIDSAKVMVVVYKKIILPNTFSPNNDGVNDVWNIEALATYPHCKLTVFNRYGQVMYKIDGQFKPWDGTYNGKPVPAGTYYYILDLENTAPELSGFVMVVR